MWKGKCSFCSASVSTDPAQHNSTPTRQLMDNDWRTWVIMFKEDSFVLIRCDSQMFLKPSE